MPVPSPSHSLLLQTLKQHGLSATRGRLLVFDLLLNSPPQSVAELDARLDGRLDRVSLYRTIKVFESIGVVHKVWLGWKYTLELSELFSAHHHHLTCLKCGKVVAMEADSALEKQIEGMAAAHGFRLTSHQVELQGYCCDCHTAVNLDPQLSSEK